jgi:hypothetical protein
MWENIDFPFNGTSGPQYTSARQRRVLVVTTSSKNLPGAILYQRPSTESHRHVSHESYEREDQTTEQRHRHELDQAD